jgi:energy-coupling factor transporter transmembrane protein EcfT
MKQYKYTEKSLKIIDRVFVFVLILALFFPVLILLFSVAQFHLGGFTFLMSSFCAVFMFFLMIFIFFILSNSMSYIRNNPQDFVEKFGVDAFMVIDSDTDKKSQVSDQSEYSNAP